MTPKRLSITRCALAFAAALAFSSLAQAAVLVVDTELDVVDAGDGLLSLREALAQAAPGDLVEFAPALSSQTIALASGELVVDRDLSISGPGPALLSIDAGGASRVLRTDPGTTVFLGGLTLTGGDTSSGGSGAGLSASGAVTLQNVAVSNNVGPANMVGGGIFSGTALTMIRTTVSGNVGEAIRNQNGPFTMIESTVRDNTGNGLVFANSGAVALVRDSTFSGNSASFAGGAINNSGGALTLDLVNSTISGNSAVGIAGGLWAGNGIVSLLNTTVTDNSATSSGGGIARGSGTVTIRNSIVAGNLAPTNPDCHVNGGGGSWVVQHSLVGLATGCPVGLTSFETADASLDLQPLADNGGPTQTHALTSDSQALDRGAPAGCTDETGAPLTSDQRGLPRPQGTRCDIGATESPNAVPTLPAASVLLLGFGLIVAAPFALRRRR